MRLDWEKQKADELLTELDSIKGTGEKLAKWNQRVETLVVFTACKIISEADNRLPQVARSNV